MLPLAPPSDSTERHEHRVSLLASPFRDGWGVPLVFFLWDGFGCCGRGAREVPLWEVWGRRRQRTEGRCSPTCDRSPRRLGARIFQRRARPAVYGHVTPGETRRWRLLATAAKGSGGGTTVQPFRPYNLRERFPFFFSLRFPHSFPSEIDRAYEAFAAGYILPSSIYSLILFWRLRVRLGPNL